MRSHRSAAPRHTGRLILGLTAIPVASVSTAALVADVASTTDRSAAWTGLAAVLGGVVLGLWIVRLSRTVWAGVRLLRSALLWICGSPADPVVRSVSSVPGAWVLVPVPVFVPAPTGRRGPPSSFR